MSRLLVSASLITACTGKSADALTCTAGIPDGVQTVIDLSWEAPPGGRSWVEFGVDGEDPLITPEQTGESPTFALVGVPAETEVAWTGITEADGERLTCSGATTTGALPVELPEVDITVADTGMSASPRFLLGAYYDILNLSYVVALDRLGRVVWYGPHEEDRISAQAELSLDGAGIVYNVFGKDTNEDLGRIRLASLDGELLADRSTPLAHHFFTQLPDGSIGFQQLLVQNIPDPDTGEMEDWAGDGIAVLAPDDSVTQVFDVWDWLEPAWNEQMSSFNIYNALDWTHGNGIKYDEDSDAWLLSLGHVGDVFEIDRVSGVPTRIFGHDGYQADGGDPFFYQHDPSLLDNGHLLVFHTWEDSRTTGALELTIDDDAQTLSETWSYDSEIISLYMGQARRLDNGNTFVNFGQGAVMREVSPDGEIVWELKTQDHVGLAQFQLLDSFYVDL